MRCMLLLMLLSSCQTIPIEHHTSVNRSVEFQQEIDELIATDAENKKWARIYLSEIDAAIVNDDLPAYVFFIREFEQIPLEIVPEHLRNEPGYVKPISDLELIMRLKYWESKIKIYLIHNK